MIAEAKKDLVKLSSEFAFTLGIAFQLKDDLLDYHGNELKTGKSIGKDFLEGKITLPLIRAFNLAKKEDLKIIKKGFESRDKKKLREVINIIDRSGAIAEVEKEINKYTIKCLNILEMFPTSVYKESLKKMVNTLKKRAK